MDILRFIHYVLLKNWKMEQAPTREHQSGHYAFHALYFVEKRKCENKHGVHTKAPKWSQEGFQRTCFCDTVIIKNAPRLHESTKMDIPRCMHSIFLKQCKCEN